MSFAYQERVISYTALYILQFIIFLIFERSRYKKKQQKSMILLSRVPLNLSLQFILFLIP